MKLDTPKYPTFESLKVEKIRLKRRLDEVDRLLSAFKVLTDAGIPVGSNGRPVDTGVRQLIRKSVQFIPPDFPFEIGHVIASLESPPSRMTVRSILNELVTEGILCVNRKGDRGKATTYQRSVIGTSDDEKPYG